MDMGGINYSCLDENLSHHLITTEYWQVSPALTSLGITTASVLLLFLLIGLPSNLLISLSILCKKLYRQPTHLLLFSLAMSDLLMCVLVMPIIIVSGYAGGFILGSSDRVRCSVCQTGVSFTASTLASLHILALMSLDRFLFIRYPLRYENIVTPGRTVTLILIVCALSCLMAILPLFGIGDIYFDHLTFSCSPRFDYHTDITKNIYYLILVVAEAMLPISILVITNIWVMCVARRQIKEIYKIKKSIGNEEQAKAYQRSLKTRMQQEKYRKQLRLLRVFGAIFVSHMITWIPLIVRVIEVLVRGSDVPSQWSNFIIITSVTSHPVLHPLIEACILPEIRRQLNICRRCCKHRGSITLGTQTEGTHVQTEGTQPENGPEGDSRCYGRCMDIINATVLPKHELAV